MTETPAAAIDAATLIVLRDADGAPEILMIERASTLAFAPGALVFPGGRVDPGDRRIAGGTAFDPDGERAARVAALRETLEETGLPIGLTPIPSGPAIEALRSALKAGMAFDAAVARSGSCFDPDALTPFARWLPAHRATRIFDTRFYLARCPVDAPPLRVDGTETTRLCWTRAADALADADAGRCTLIFPTRRTLERLAQFDGYASAVADAHAHPTRTITPVEEDRDGTTWLCIPEDIGYPITGEPLDRVRRG